MMRFFRTRRLFANQLRPGMLLGYVLDLIFVVTLLMVVFNSVPQLRAFGTGRPTVLAEPAAVAMVGFLGLYGTRISMYVAMIRRNRMPQTIEWWCTLLGFALVFTLWPFDGSLLRAYAALHGYGFCHATGSGSLAKYLFARAHACPPLTTAS